MSSRIWLFVLLGWLLVSAPTAGSVGSCGVDELGNSADFMSYCQRREELVCVRRFLRKELTAHNRDECRWDAIDRCERSAFATGCLPTRRRTEACLNALSSFDTVQTPERDLTECKASTLCNTMTAPNSDAGVENP